jgi:hypothetical protein
MGCLGNQQECNKVLIRGGHDCGWSYLVVLSWVGLRLGHIWVEMVGLSYAWFGRTWSWAKSGLVKFGIKLGCVAFSKCG